MMVYASVEGEGAVERVRGVGSLSGRHFVFLKYASNKI